jgi:hypothetical protein
VDVAHNVHITICNLSEPAIMSRLLGNVQWMYSTLLLVQLVEKMPYRTNYPNNAAAQSGFPRRFRAVRDANDCASAQAWLFEVTCLFPTLLGHGQYLGTPISVFLGRVGDVM